MVKPHALQGEGRSRIAANHHLSAGESMKAGFCRPSRFLLLLALGVLVIRVLMCRLRVLLRTRCVLLAFGVVAPAVMFGGSAMCLPSLLMLRGCLVVLVSSHAILID
ncbi:hypothetical protein ACE103_29585 [Bradyrhizobium sp. ma5]|uniref:hypothetical protein n=1 Tax=Bradyrhizobium sp. ma5 TaxID=3344828 RepID=UPI0035D41918